MGPDRVGLIPAAGYATRLGLESGSKEVQPVRGRPVMEYLAERMRLGGADRIRVATRPEKTDVIDLAAAWNMEIVTGYPNSVSESLRLAASGIDDEAVVLFGFPDTIWSPIDGFRSLCRKVENGADIALGVFQSPYPERSDVAILESSGRVVRIDVKPKQAHSDLVWACGVARWETLRDLTVLAEPGIAFSRRAEHTPIDAVRLGRVIDVGTQQAFDEAETDPVFTGTEP